MLILYMSKSYIWQVKTYQLLFSAAAVPPGAPLFFWNAACGWELSVSLLWAFNAFGAKLKRPGWFLQQDTAKGGGG